MVICYFAMYICYVVIVIVTLRCVFNMVILLLLLFWHGYCYFALGYFALVICFFVMVICGHQDCHGPLNDSYM